MPDFRDVRNTRGRTISGVLSNLINGISQQPSNIRFSNQAESCINMMPTVQEQCDRRNPLEVVREIINTITDIDIDTKIHFYRRDDNESYLIFLNGSTIQALNLATGAEETVTMSQPGGDNYHTCTGRAVEEFFLYTYKDTTFIVNRESVTALEAATTPVRTPEALVRVKDVAGAGYIYTVKVKVNTTTNTFTYPSVAADTVSTVATALRNQINTWITGLGSPGATAVVENIIHITHPSLSVSVEATDNRAGTAITAIGSAVSKVADLPSFAPNGYTLTVNSADNSVANDSYYRFTTDGVTTFGSGVWKESTKGGIQYQLDAATMPHQLVRLSGGGFEYKQVTWGERAVGDDFTNPAPLFVGSKIHSLFLASNRLGVCAGSSAVLSRVDEVNWFNFWRTTTLSQLETDPITIPVPSGAVNRVYWARQWGGELLLFGDIIDAAVSWNGTFSQNRITINTPSRFGIARLIPPMLSGGNLFFPKNRIEHSLLYEYSTDAVTGQRDAKNLSDYASTFIPKDVIAMDGTEKDFIAMLADGDRSTLYCYNYNRPDSNRLVQQAFHEWRFDPGMELLGLFEDNAKLLIPFRWQGRIFLGRVALGQRSVDEGRSSKVYMDLRIDETAVTSVTYNPSTNRTTVTLPWSYGTGTKTLELRSTFLEPSSGQTFPQGFIPTPDSQTATTFVVVGDWRLAEFYVGLNYASIYEPAKFYNYVSNPETGAQLADLWVHLLLSKVVVAASKVGAFKVQIINRNTGVVVGERETPIEYDASGTVWDELVSRVVTLTVNIKKPLEQFKIRLYNDTTKGCAFNSIAWVAEGVSNVS